MHARPEPRRIVVARARPTVADRFPTQEQSHRRRLPRHRRPHPHAELRHRRRHPARQHRPQLRPAPHPAPRGALWPHARLPRAVLLQARGRPRRKRWAMSSPKSARASSSTCEEVLKREEEAFNRTLDQGNSKLFERRLRQKFERQSIQAKRDRARSSEHCQAIDSGSTFAFKLYDTYGFPLDLTELMARERGLTVDTAGFEKLMDEQRARARAAQKKEVIRSPKSKPPRPRTSSATTTTHTGADVHEVVALKDKTAVVLEQLRLLRRDGRPGRRHRRAHRRAASSGASPTRRRAGNTWLHFIEGGDAPARRQARDVAVRRRAPRTPSSATTPSRTCCTGRCTKSSSQEATQKGSFVGPDKLTFDFNSAAAHARAGRATSSGSSTNASSKTPP